MTGKQWLCSKGLYLDTDESFGLCSKGLYLDTDESFDARFQKAFQGRDPDLHEVLSVFDTCKAGGIYRNLGMWSDMILRSASIYNYWDLLLEVSKDHRMSDRLRCKALSFLPYRFIIPLLQDKEYPSRFRARCAFYLSRRYRTLKMDLAFDLEEPMELRYAAIPYLSGACYLKLILEKGADLQDIQGTAVGWYLSVQSPDL